MRRGAPRLSQLGSWLVLSFLSLLSCLALACPGCTRGGSGYYGTTEPKHGPDEIWTNLGTEPEYIDPGKASDAAGGMVIVNVFAGLTQPHPVTLEAMPDIATRWALSEDGRRYTFSLRESTWSDGVPLTAADFEYSWKRVLDPKTASKYATFLYPVRYAEMFHRRALVVRGLPSLDEAMLRAALDKHAAGVPIEAVRLAPDLGCAFVLVGGDDAEKASLRDKLIASLSGVQLGGAEPVQVTVADSQIVGVRAEAPDRLVVDLEDPLPYFLDLVKFYTAMPVPRHVIERLEHAGKNPDLWTRPENIVCNGAYRVHEWKFRQHVWLHKNERYWDAANVRTPRIRLAMVESYNTTLNLYEAGELDSIGQSALPAEFMDELAKYRDFHRAPYLGTYFYWVNTKAAPLDDVRVRKALSLAIDRASLIKYVARGGQIPSADLVPAGLGGYEGPGSSIFDPKQARVLLAEAGYGPARPLPRVTLSYNTAEAHKQLAEAIQAMWKEHLGVDIEIENQEWKVYLKNLQTSNFQLSRMGWIGDYPDPFTFLELLRSGNGNNHSSWSDARYDALLRQANATFDKPARSALLRKAEQLAMDNVPVIPLYVYTNSEMVKPYVRGHALNYENRLLLKYWWIDRRFYEGVPQDRLPDGFPKLASAEAR